MKVLIKKIKTGAYMGEDIFEFWIYGETLSGNEIKIFHGKNFDLRNNIGKEIDCLICAYRLNDIKIGDKLKINSINDKFRGKYLGKYTIPEYWNCVDSGFYHALETDDGILLLYGNELEVKIVNHFQHDINGSLKIGDFLSFYAEKLELIAWRQIEE